MNVRQSKYKNLYKAGLIIIAVCFIALFILDGQELELNYFISFILFGGGGFCAAARAFYLDRYFKVMENKELVDFWIFINEKPNFDLIAFILIIRPVNTPSSNPEIEKLRRTVNKFTYATYLILICIILFQILIKQD